MKKAQSKTNKKLWVVIAVAVGIAMLVGMLSGSRLDTQRPLPLPWTMMVAASIILCFNIDNVVVSCVHALLIRRTTWDRHQDHQKVE